MPEPRANPQAAQAMSPEDVATRTFPTVRRGLDADAVRRFLEDVAVQLRQSRAREAALAAELAEAEAKAAAPELDEAALTAAVGIETARVLRVAHEAAQEVVAKAEAKADGLLDEARRVHEARAQTAEAEAAQIVEDGRVAAEDLVERTKQECRSMLEEAREARRRVLDDLASRRRELHSQIEQLRAAKDALFSIVDGVAGEVGAVRDRLAGSEDEARGAAEAVALQLAAGGDRSDAFAPGSLDAWSPEHGAAEHGAAEHGAAEHGARLDDVPVEALEAAPAGPEALPEEASPAPEAGPDTLPEAASPAPEAGPDTLPEAASPAPEAGPEPGLPEAEPVAGVAWPDPDTLPEDEPAGPTRVDDAPVEQAGPGRAGPDEALVADPAGEPAGGGEDAAAAEDEAGPEDAAAEDELVAGWAAGADHGAEAGDDRARGPEADGPEADGPEAEGPEAEGPEAEGQEAEGHGPEGEGPGAEGDADPGKAVEALFARIRASRDEEVARARAVLGAPGSGEVAPNGATANGSGGSAGHAGPAALEALVEAPAVRGASEEEEALRAGPGPGGGAEEAAGTGYGEVEEEALAAGVDPDGAGFLAGRDERLDPVRLEVGRAMKRVLRSQQNELLDRARSLKASEGGILLAGERAEAELAEASVGGLEAAFAAGREAAGAAPDMPGVGKAARGIARAVAAEVTGAIRDRLAEELESLEASGDLEEGIGDLVGVAFRDWKGARVDAVAGDATLRSFAAGTLAGAADTGTRLRWVLASDQPCADCDDNALCEPLAPGEAFPTGQAQPPLHPGCRCGLVAEPG